MPKTTRIVLDVLKPHQPNAVDFASTLAELDTGYQVRITVTEVDKKTESTIIVIEGTDVNFDNIKYEIEKMGASVHSIDEVEVAGSSQE